MILTLQESAEFKAFMQRVGETAAEYQMALRSSRDLATIYHAQGALQVCDFIFDLPEIMRLEAQQKEQQEEHY